MIDRALTPDEIEMVREALGVAAARAEAAGARMAPGMGVHHTQRAEAMRQLCARLHNHLCLLVDDDVVMIDVSILPPAERDAIMAHERRVA